MTDHRSTGRSLLAIGLAATAVWLMLAVTCASALAAPGYRQTRVFGSTSPGALTGASGVLARSGSNQVLVADPNAGRVLRYSTAGTYQGFIDTSGQLSGPNLLAGVPAADGDLFVQGSDPTTAAPVIARYSSAGAFKDYVQLGAAPSQIGFISGMATDPRNGTLYVISDKSIYVFTGSGAYSGRFGGSPEVQESGPLGVDGTGAIYVFQVAAPTLKYASRLAAPTTLQGGAPTPFQGAVDPVSNHVFVLGQTSSSALQFDEFSAQGALIRSFAAGDVTGVGGVAVDGNTASVFVSDPNVPAIKVFEPSNVPVVTTGQASQVESTSATLNGTIDPDGDASSYYFEYGTSPNFYEATTDPVSVGAGDDPVAASAAITGLAANTTYYYRIVGTNELGARVNGPEQSFTTPPGPPTIVSQTASDLTSSSATLKASINPNNEATTASFEYGVNDPGAATTVTDPQDAGAGTSPTAIQKAIAGLSPGTEYRFRVIAQNGTGTTTGDYQTFTTPLAAPVASAAAPSGVTASSAVVNGTVDTQGLAGSYRFTVSATDSPYSYTTPAVDLPAASGSRAVSAQITGLPAGGTFTVRLTVTTSTSSTVSAASGFSTPPGAPALAPPAGDPATSPYDCVKPRINQPRGTLRPGQTVVLTGTDLGYSGSVSFGSRLGRVTEYTPSAIKVVVPSQANGTLLTRVRCAVASNTIEVKVAKPSNAFTARTTVSGTKATARVRVPGRGNLILRGRYLKTVNVKPSKAGTVTARTALTSSGKRALERSKGALKVTAEIRYRPTGGTTRVAKRSLSFKP